MKIPVASAEKLVLVVDAQSTASMEVDTPQSCPLAVRDINVSVPAGRGCPTAMCGKAVDAKAASTIEMKFLDVMAFPRWKGRTEMSPDWARLFPGPGSPRKNHAKWQMRAFLTLFTT